MNETSVLRASERLLAAARREIADQTSVKLINGHVAIEPRASLIH